MTVSDKEAKAGVERNFKEALEVLAASAEDQVRVTEPGDVPLEIIEDYLAWAKPYIGWFKSELSGEVTEQILQLEVLVDELSESVFQESNFKSMLQPEWQPLRDKASALLDKLGWQSRLPSPYIDKGNGVFWRR